jgi:hypothetical protein
MAYQRIAARSPRLFRCATAGRAPATVFCHNATREVDAAAGHLRDVSGARMELRALAARSEGGRPANRLVRSSRMLLRQRPESAHRRADGRRGPLGSTRNHRGNARQRQLSGACRHAQFVGIRGALAPGFALRYSARQCGFADRAQPSKPRNSGRRQRAGARAIARRAHLVRLTAARGGGVWRLDRDRGSCLVTPGGAWHVLPTANHNVRSDYNRRQFSAVRFRGWHLSPVAYRPASRRPVHRRSVSSYRLIRLRRHDTTPGKRQLVGALAGYFWPRAASAGVRHQHVS